jgi:hypothetical protein
LPEHGIQFAVHHFIHPLDAFADAEIKGFHSANIWEEAM